MRLTGLRGSAHDVAFDEGVFVGNDAMVVKQLNAAWADEQREKKKDRRDVLTLVRDEYGPNVREVRAEIVSAAEGGESLDSIEQ